MGTPLTNTTSLSGAFDRVTAARVAIPSRSRLRDGHYANRLRRASVLNTLAFRSERSALACWRWACVESVPRGKSNDNQGSSSVTTLAPSQPRSHEVRRPMAARSNRADAGDDRHNDRRALAWTGNVWRAIVPPHDCGVASSSLLCCRCCWLHRCLLGKVRVAVNSSTASE